MANKMTSETVTPVCQVLDEHITADPVNFDLVKFAGMTESGYCPDRFSLREGFKVYPRCDDTIMHPCDNSGGEKYIIWDITYPGDKFIIPLGIKIDWLRAGFRVQVLERLDGPKSEYKVIPREYRYGFKGELSVEVCITTFMPIKWHPWKPIARIQIVRDSLEVQQLARKRCNISGKRTRLREINARLDPGHGYVNTVNVIDLTE